MVVLKENGEVVERVEEIVNCEELKCQVSELWGYDRKMSGGLIYER